MTQQARNRASWLASKLGVSAFRADLAGSLELPDFGAEGLALTSCRSIVVTQGARFYLYQRAAGGSWPETPR